MEEGKREVIGYDARVFVSWNELLGGARTTQRSSGRRPVCFAIRASIRGPISSPSWKANTKSGEPSRDNVR